MLLSQLHPPDLDFYSSLALTYDPYLPVTSASSCLPSLDVVSPAPYKPPRLAVTVIQTSLCRQNSCLIIAEMEQDNYMNHNIKETYAVRSIITGWLTITLICRTSNLNLLHILINLFLWLFYSN